jgi:hypothetical protein
MQYSIRCGWGEGSRARQSTALPSECASSCNLWRATRQGVRLTSSYSFSSIRFQHLLYTTTVVSASPEIGLPALVLQHMACRLAELRRQLLRKTSIASLVQPYPQ